MAKLTFWDLLQKAWPIGMMIIAWSGHATVDGKIDLVELIELMTMIIKELGLDIKIVLPLGMPLEIHTLSPAAQEILLTGKGA